MVSLAAHLDRSAVRDETPQFLDLRVCESDASIRPVARQAACGQPIGLSVDENVATGRAALGRSICIVGLIGIGDAQAQVNALA